MEFLQIEVLAIVWFFFSKGYFLEIYHLFVFIDLFHLLNPHISFSVLLDLDFF